MENDEIFVRGKVFRATADGNVEAVRLCDKYDTIVPVKNRMDLIVPEVGPQMLLDSFCAFRARMAPESEQGGEGVAVLVPDGEFTTTTVEVRKIDVMTRGEAGKMAFELTPACVYRFDMDEVAEAIENSGHEATRELVREVAADLDDHESVWDKITEIVENQAEYHSETASDSM